MAIFTALKRFLPYIGILKFNRSHANIIAFASKAIQCGAILFGFFGTLTFLLFDKEAVIGVKVQCFGGFATNCYFVALYLFYVMHGEKFVDLIKLIEKHIDERERKYARKMYKEKSAEVEAMTKKVETFIAASVLILIIPTTITCYLKYYVLNMGADSFKTFIPMLWVPRCLWGNFWKIWATHFFQRADFFCS